MSRRSGLIYRCPFGQRRHGFLVANLARDWASLQRPQGLATLATKKTLDFLAEKA